MMQSACRGGALCEDWRMDRASPPSPLNLQSIKTPEFLPDGSGKGEDKEFLMRNQQIIRLYAQAGEKRDISLRHLSHKHKLSLQYALFDQQKNILHNEAVNPGRKTRISVVAPHTGCYTFTVSGGTSVEFSDYKASGTYTQDFFLSFPGGKNHLIFGHPERRLKMK